MHWTFGFPSQNFFVLLRSPWTLGLTFCGLILDLHLAHIRTYFCYYITVLWSLNDSIMPVQSYISKVGLFCGRHCRLGLTLWDIFLWPGPICMMHVKNKNKCTWVTVHGDCRWKFSTIKAKRSAYDFAFITNRVFKSSVTYDSHRMDVPWQVLARPRVHIS